MPRVITENGKTMTKKAIWLGMIGTTLVAGTALAWWFYWPIHVIKNNVSKSMIDPESAQFSDVKFYRKSGAGCGSVNGKNRMGGYVGMKNFISFEDGSVAFKPEKPDMPEASKVMADCRKVLDETTDLTKLAENEKKARACVDVAYEEVTVETTKLMAFLEHQERQCPKE